MVPRVGSALGVAATGCYRPHHVHDHRAAPGCAASCRRSRGCAGTTVIALSPQAQPIEIATGDPDRSQFTYLGDVQGTAKSTDIAKANTNARNDLRNKAAATGATIVVLDTNTAGNAMDWTGRTQVVLSGRAFRSKPAQ